MNKTKVILLILFFLSGLFDIFSTIYHKNFLVLESNLISGISTIWIAIIFKLLVIVALSAIIIKDKVLMNTNFSRYFYIHLIVCFTIIQFMAGANNLIAQTVITHTVNEQTGMNYSISQVPQHEVVRFVVPKQMSMLMYFQMIMQNLILPLGLALVSFKLYQMLYEVDKNGKDV
jgi:hypothetical protein